jgi:hypothetical protein
MDMKRQYGTPGAIERSHALREGMGGFFCIYSPIPQIFRAAIGRKVRWWGTGTRDQRGMDRIGLCRVVLCCDGACGRWIGAPLRRAEVYAGCLGRGGLFRGTFVVPLAEEGGGGKVSHGEESLEN